MQKDSLSIILGNVDSAVIIISGEVSHVSVETHAVVKATLVRFTAEVARLEYKYNVNLKFDSLFCLLRDSMNNFNFQKCSPSQCPANDYVAGSRRALV